MPDGHAMVLAPVDEIVESMESVPRNGFHPTPVPGVPKRRNAATGHDMLAAGLSYAMILRAVDERNAELDKPDRVTIDSIRKHTVRHFPVQSIRRLLTGRILERRAQENGVDFVKGVATAITPMAFDETVR